MSKEMVYKAMYYVISDAYDYIAGGDEKVGPYMVGVYEMASAMIELIKKDRKKTEEKK